MQAPLCVEGWDEALYEIGKLWSETVLLVQSASVFSIGETEKDHEIKFSIMTLNLMEQSDIVPTRRNLTRHPHLTEALIDTHGLTQAILLEFIRNKEETYFIAADILRNICSHKKGVERLRGLPSLVKRLHALVENIKKKAVNDKRNLRTVATNEQTEVED
ncbi:hypothetical protein Tco_0217726 [Tanacetum coccineum]